MPMRDKWQYDRLKIMQCVEITQRRRWMYTCDLCIWLSDRVTSSSWSADLTRTGMKDALAHVKELFPLSTWRRRVNQRHRWWRPCPQEHLLPYWVRSAFTRVQAQAYRLLAVSIGLHTYTFDM